MRRPVLVPLAVLAAALTAAPAAADDNYGALTYAVASSYAVMVPDGSQLGRAQAELAAGRYLAAVRLLEPLADGAGGNSPATLLAGYANLGAGKTGRAELYFDRALKRDRANPYALHGLGLAALARGDRGAATNLLVRLEIARERCAGACGRAEQLEAAVASLRRAIG